MSQLRKDPFGPTWVIFSPELGLETSDFSSVSRDFDSSILAPGNEIFLDKEIFALRPNNSKINQPNWTIRVIENPDALLEARELKMHSNQMFSYANNSGYQEIIVEHPNPKMSIEDMPLDHLVDILKVYRDRMEKLSAKPGIRHIQLTRNVGKEAGSRYDHPHAQILAVGVRNRWLSEEMNAAKTYYKEHQSCLFCDVLETELSAKERLISANENFVAISPYAAKTPFETWILPKRHDSNFSSIKSTSLKDLASLLKDVIRAINGSLNYPPYNLMLHTLPIKGENRYHWHIELLPRLTKRSGFDWSSGFYVNPTPPEDATKILKEALALQGVGL